MLGSGPGLQNHRTTNQPISHWLNSGGCDEDDGDFYPRILSKSIDTAITHLYMLLLDITHCNSTWPKQPQRTPNRIMVSFASISTMDICPKVPSQAQADFQELISRGPSPAGWCLGLASPSAPMWCRVVLVRVKMRIKMTMRENKKTDKEEVDLDVFSSSIIRS